MRESKAKAEFGGLNSEFGVLVLELKQHNSEFEFPTSPLVQSPTPNSSLCSRIISTISSCS